MPHTTYGLLGAVRTHRVTVQDVRETVATGRPNACNLCHLDQPLEWTASKLSAWYGQSKWQDLDRENASVAVGVVGILRGDAAQRALVAWAMGRPEAHAAAGSAWMAPYLSIYLDDPYSAVRYIAAEALAGIPNFGPLDFDYIALEA